MQGYEDLYGHACLAEVLNGGALTGLACDRQFGEKSELLTRLGPAPLYKRLTTVHCFTSLRAREIRTKYVVL